MTNLTFTQSTAHIQLTRTITTVTMLKLHLTTANKTRNPKVMWEELCHHPSQQRITMPQSPHWLQWDASHSPQHCPFPRQSSPHLIHQSLDRPHSLPQKASRSNQPFCHSTPSIQIGDRSVLRATYA